MQLFNHTVFSDTELLGLFRERSDAGLGYDGDNVTGEHVAHLHELDAYSSNGKLILVADANGPWAVTVC
jgi:hypothetical protein